MTANEYASALAKAKNELGTCIQQRRELDAKIIKLQAAVASLSMLCDDPFLTAPDEFPNATTQMLIGVGFDTDAGLTSATRAVLAGSPTTWFNAASVKENLDANSFNWSSYTQPMSALHTVLKRLSVKFLDTKTEGGKTFYRWKEHPFAILRKL